MPNKIHTKAGGHSSTSSCIFFLLQQIEIKDIGGDGLASPEQLKKNGKPLTLSMSANKQETCYYANWEIQRQDVNFENCALEKNKEWNPWQSMYLFFILL